MTASLTAGHSVAADNDWNWSGFYLGAHAGAGRGVASFSNPYGSPVYGDDVTTDAFLAGLQGGYNWIVAPKWLVGVEANASILSGHGQNTCFQPSSIIVGANCQVFPGEIASFAGRLGYLTGPSGKTMIFGKAGLAWMHSELAAVPNNTGFNGFNLTPDPGNGAASERSFSSLGWTVGAGVEYALSPRWSTSVGYDYMRFGGGNIATPDTSSVTSGGVVTASPGGALSTVAQSLHVVRIGLNYHLGGGSGASNAEAAPAEPAFRSGWEFEGGLRYWYSWGNFQSSNGPGTGGLVSRLPYTNMEGHSGELFARLDTPINVFVKALAGGGGISHGTAYDEDWGLEGASEPTGYEITRSGVRGSFNYFTFDVGYNVLRGADHKVGLFAGYHRFQTVMDMVGCDQIVAPGSGICFPNHDPNLVGISEMDTWHALRLGAAAEVMIVERLKVSADVAYLPYAYVDGLDIHRLRQPPVNFPVKGSGNGVQLDVILSYEIFDRFSIGLGGRYWAMWTNVATQTDFPTNYLTLSTDRYGVLVQAAYKFM